MHVLFDKQCRVPARQTRALTTHQDGQRSIMLKIYQGEHSRVDDNDLIGTFVFSGIQIAPAGSVGLNVTFDLTAEGQLRVSAHDPETDDHVEAHIRFNPEGKRTRKSHRKRRRMQPNTPAADAPIEDELLPPAPAALSFDMPASSLINSIEGERPPTDFLDDWQSKPKEGWWGRLGRRIFGN